MLSCSAVTKLTRRIRIIGKAARSRRHRPIRKLAFLHGWRHFRPPAHGVTLPEAQRRLTELVRDLAIQGDLVGAAFLRTPPSPATW